MEDGRTDWKSSIVLCIWQAPDKHLGVAVMLPAAWPHTERCSGLASAEEYPEEYLDSSSPSLGEEEDSQFRGMPVENSCKRQGGKHANGSGRFVEQRSHTIKLKPRIHEYKQLPHLALAGQVILSNGTYVTGHDESPRQRWRSKSKSSSITREFSNQATLGRASGQKRTGLGHA